MARSEPHRRCAGCGRVAPKQSLVRLAVGEDQVLLVDRAATLPGRGAYVCAGQACLHEAARRGRLSRAFRRPVQIPPKTLESGV
ncbi:MAG TPA: YlxR family protein [Solirubrobacteraceae bacterium]|nr:YlxR family protein [Solirubrobacteraceae bacterium]